MTEIKQKLVLIGNGMAGMRTIDELLKIAPEKYDITVFGSEPYGNYNRIMLSPVLAGDKTINDIIIHDEKWYRQHDITLHTNTTVTDIDRVKKKIVTDTGLIIEYDKVIMATGSNPFVLPIPGHDLPGVVSFRDIADVEMMMTTAETRQHAVVIGGGLLGLEAANGLMLQGMDVTVVHLSDTLMNQQLDSIASGLIQQALEEKGLHFRMAHMTEALIGDERVRAVRFKNGDEIPADLVVMAVGVKPNIALAKASGIQCEKGVLVDDTMQTYSPDIYAVGECIQHRHQVFGLVAPLYEQAKVCANHLAEWGIARYVTKVTSTQLKVTGIKVFSTGHFKGNDDSEIISYFDPQNAVYKKLVIQQQKLVGAILSGETQDGNWYFDLINEQQDITQWRDRLIFGRQFCDEGTEATV